MLRFINNLVNCLFVKMNNLYLGICIFISVSLNTVGYVDCTIIFPYYHVHFLKDCTIECLRYYIHAAHYYED